MSQKIKQKSIRERAEELVRNARAADWILIRAEEYQEKFELSNATIRVFSSMSWRHRLFGYKKLLKQYLIQLDGLEKQYRKTEKEKYEELKKELSDDLPEFEDNGQG